MNNDHTIISRFINRHAQQAGRIINEFSAHDIAAFVNQMPPTNHAAVFDMLERYKAAQTFELLDKSVAIHVIEQLPVFKSAVILRQTNPTFKDDILASIDKDISTDLKIVLSYAPGSVGAHMDTAVITFYEDATVRESLKKIKKQKALSTPYIFVITSDEKLTGIVELQSLIAAGSKDKLRTLAKNNIPKIFAQINVNAILKHEGWLRYNTLPVIDRSDYFLGGIKLENIRKTEDADKERQSRQAHITSQALGDLYKIGLGSIMSIADEQFGKPDSK